MLLGFVHGRSKVDFGCSMKIGLQRTRCMLRPHTGRVVRWP
jgi:hypothetical protein